MRNERLSINRSLIRFTAILIAIASAPHCVVGQDNAPYARSLFEGVRSARLALDQGRLEYEKKITYNPDTPEAKDRSLKGLLIWNQNSLYGNEFHEVKSTSSRSGEWRIGIRHDGELLLNSNYSGVVIRNVEGDHPWAPDIYDPRILGVNNGPRITLYAEDELFPSGLGWASLVEIETQLQFEHHESPVTASHVRWHYDAKYASDFWISNQPHFPIHQMNIQSGRDRYRCYYDDDSPIPNRIVNELLENDGTVKRHVDMRIVSLDTESSIDESNFKIDRLEMDIGEQVSDSRIRRVIGFWDGEKIVETQEAAFKNAASSNAQAANTDSETNPYVVSLAIGVIALAALVAWRRFG